MPSKKRFLLVNPWVYDFSAYSFWARPLGLLKVTEYLSQFDLDINFVDCLEIEKFKHYGTGKYRSEEVAKPDVLKDIPFKYKRYGISEEEFLFRVKKNGPYDMVLITSIMGYWYPGVIRAVDIIKSLFKDAYIILGGIYATLYYQHALNNSGADFVYKGKLDERFDGILHNLGLKKISLKKNYYKMGVYETFPFAPILTSYGCPFNCSYCASKLIYNGYLRCDNAEVLQEIRDLYNLGVRNFAFYDDALLVESEKYIKPLLRDVTVKFNNIKFHTPNGLHARFIDDELALLFKKANFKTIRLSLETTNPIRQRDTGNKVNNEDLVNAVKILQSYGFTKKELGVYLMYGLPGQSIEEVREGVELLKKLNVRVNLAEFSPIPGTDAWKELIRKGVIDENIDPLLTNNSIFSLLFWGYRRDIIYNLKWDVKNYNAM
ncbi:MAG: radical SAM protein [Proteobacteria bacterium]|nr:radical SAM protein [Pseudomonadota bacterium]